MGQLVFQATAGGQTALIGPNPSSNFSLNVPAVNGTLVTTGDTGTVTNTMLASNVYTAPGTIGSVTPNTGAFTTLSASTSITNSSLTSGRVTYAGTGGLLQDSANMTFNGTTLTLANDASISGLTVGKGGGATASSSAFGVGALNANSGVGNTALGYQTLNANTSGTYSTAVGYQAGYSNTTGGVHAFGTAVLYANTTGSANAGFGGYDGASSIGSALRNNTTGSNNSAFGVGAMNQNTTGGLNVAVGTQSLYSNTTANYNTAVGFNALYFNTTGTNLDAVGAYVLNKNTTGVANIAMGGSGTIPALYNNTTGSYNVGLGQGALFSNTTASNNTAVGYQAGYSNQTGANNVFVGYSAGYNANTSGGHTFVGYNAGLNSNSSSTANTFFGNGAGSLVTSGIKNTIIGRYDGNTGGLDIRTSSNYIVLSDGDGNPLAYVQNGGSWFQKSNSATWSITSDARLKKNIVDNTTGLDAINAIQVRNFEYRTADEITDLPKDQAVEVKGIQLGAIAQEIQAILPECVKTESTGVMSVDTTNLTWYLINAVKELNAKITALENK